MARIVCIAGSWRKGSFNTALAQAAAQCAPQGCTIEHADIRDFPLYDGDLETSAFPTVVAALKERIAGASGLLLVSPEYNHSVPGVLKNAVDWLSRPSRDIARVFNDCAAGLIGATIGPSGTRLAQVAWLPVFRTLGMRPYYGKAVNVAEAAKAFGPDGALTDDKLRGQLTAYMAGFAKFAGEVQRGAG